MKANLVFGDLNACGGGERLSLVTMQALLKMGINFDLTTFRKPDLSKLEKVYGNNLAMAMKNIVKTNVVDLLQVLQQPADSTYDITINTHGDVVPYYQSSFSKDNALTYCHFPTAKYFIEKEDTSYLQRNLNIVTDNNSFRTEYSDYLRTRKKEYFRTLKFALLNLMNNSIVLTNSEFSRRTIMNAFGLNDVLILSPPVDTESFRNTTLLTSDDNRKDIILVVSRIDPYKAIENAIKLGKMLKDENIGTGMKIVGTLYRYNLNYYEYLKKMVIDLNVGSYISFEINASLNKLLSIMREAKVYFHPMREEPFGMSVVEAMAAGLVPIIPDVGGPTEFVSRKFHFNSLEKAAEIISDALSLPHEERIRISNSVHKFSMSAYIKGFQHVVSKLLTH